MATVPARASVRARVLLPQEYKGYECPLDKFGLVVYQAGGDAKSFVICPLCYNDPPFAEARRSAPF